MKVMIMHGIKIKVNKGREMRNDKKNSRNASRKLFVGQNREDGQHIEREVSI